MDVFELLREVDPELNERRTEKIQVSGRSGRRLFGKAETVRACYVGRETGPREPKNRVEITP